MSAQATETASESRQVGGVPYRWVYLWHWPIRAMHWVAAGAIVVLAVTGFYIGRPAFMTTGEPSAHYLMGWVRMVHFAAAGVLVATGIVRVYWLFAGNRYERWTALLPVRRRDWANLLGYLKYYLLVDPWKRPHYLGHHPMQQLTYTTLYLVVVVQVVTGFALYGLSNPGGIFHASFGWLIPLFGGAQGVRLVHHILTWFFFVYVPLHVYLSLRADVVDLEGEMSSIFSGGRFVRADVEFEDE